MSKSKTAKPTVRGADTFLIPKEDGKSEGRLLAEISAATETLNAVTARTFAQPGMGAIDLTECVAVMHAKVGAVTAGDLSGAEAMLAAQAAALDAIFFEMARRAALNLGQHLQATETYMRLALKAQGQARATLQTLAEVKNPRPVAFVKQANIANGPQQVNNVSNAPARAENLEGRQSKLLEHETDGERLDTGATGAAGGGDKELATVEEIHRPPIR